jgi:hypothetical protein
MACLNGMMQCDIKYRRENAPFRLSNRKLWDQASTLARAYAWFAGAPLASARL